MLYRQDNRVRAVDSVYPSRENARMFVRAFDSKIDIRADALADPRVGLILLDVVLGYGGHLDPAGHLAAFLAGRDRRTLIVASVTGTDADPQPREDQIPKLAEAGVIVVDSNADAAEAAIAAIGA